LGPALSSAAAKSAEEIGEDVLGAEAFGRAVGAAAALALMALPLAEPIRLAVALIAGLAIYWAVLRFLLKLTGESLALTHFVTHASEAEAR